VYQGPSPDEIALVDAAKMMGFEFVKSTKQETTIKIRGELKTVQLLEVFPFNSDRKRMSIVIKEKGVLKLYTKGADSIVKGRVSHKSELNLDAELT
jgi:magnesium-transporting ATPase (P-type)